MWKCCVWALCRRREWRGIRKDDEEKRFIDVRWSEDCSELSWLLAFGCWWAVERLLEDWLEDERRLEQRFVMLNMMNCEKQNIKRAAAVSGSLFDGKRKGGGEMTEWCSSLRVGGADWPSVENEYNNFIDVEWWMISTCEGACMEILLIVTYNGSKTKHTCAENKSKWHPVKMLMFGRTVVKNVRSLIPLDQRTEGPSSKGHTSS